MPNVLILSFEGFSFSSRQLYEQLLPKLLSRAVVHESLTVQDALNYVSTGWPSVILVTDSGITEEEEEYQQLLSSIKECTFHGSTTIFMGVFAETVDHPRLNSVFRHHFGLPWRVADVSSHDITLLSRDECMIRTTSLAPSFYAKALYLSKVHVSQAIYSVNTGATSITYAAYGRVGLGKLGYIGDFNFGEESERLILAMSHLDRPEDYLQGSEGLSEDPS